MGKILHLIPDEKITEDVIENFEKVFQNNIFFVLGDNVNRRYCKTERDNVVFGDLGLFSKDNIGQDVVAVVVHGLNYVFAKLLVELDVNVKTAWFAWGFDVYNLPKIRNTLYAPETLSYLKNNNRKYTLINSIKKYKVLRSLYYKHIKKTDDFYSVYELAHKRIDYFCTYIKEDYDFFVGFYPNRFAYQEIGYSTINQYLAGQSNLRINLDARNIILGNSNSVENNHLDALEIINKSGFKERVFVPLSYGNNQKYKSVVLNRGKELLEENFCPILDFMERDKYFNLLSSCSTAVFYHYRQQAMGNILALLYMGVRVYLSSKNPIYYYFKRLGIYVFDFDIDFSLYSNTILEKDKQEINRKNLDKLFTENVLQSQYLELVNKLIDVDK